jgi:hypothetical protein
MSELVCPHCGLPPVLPDVCTPEVNEAIEKQIARDWELFTEGYKLGQRVVREELAEGGHD